jgi:hypothetical protein
LLKLITGQVRKIGLEGAYAKNKLQKPFLTTMALIRGLGYKGGNTPGLDSWRGLAKPFFYCGGQASRIISVKNLLIAMSSFLLPKNFSAIIWATKSALSPHDYSPRH